MSDSLFTETQNDVDLNHSKNNLKGMLSFLNESDVEDNNEAEIDLNKNYLEKNQNKNEISEILINSVPIKRNTKSYKQDKIKLMAESQRLMRENQFKKSFTYKPKQFENIGEFIKIIQLNKETQEIQNIENNKENNSKHNDTIVNNSNTTIEETYEPLPLTERLGLSDNIKNSLIITQPFHSQTNISQKIENLLKNKINNSSKGFIDLKSEKQYEKEKNNRNSIIARLNKTIKREIPFIEKETFTDLNTIVKTINPETKVETLKIEVISVKKDSGRQLEKVYKGIDPIVARVVQERLTGEELVKWTAMPAKEKFNFHKKLLLKEADEKRRLLREKRNKDLPIVDKVEKQSKKEDNDGLSDDDSEWFEDKEHHSDSEDEDDVTTDDAEDSDDSADIVDRKKKRGGHVRVGFIDDEDMDIPPFVDDTTVVNKSEDLFADESYLNKQVIKQVNSPQSGGLRDRKHYELTPKLKIKDNLSDIVLPENVTNVINELKTKFGLVNKLIVGDSSVLLLPTMKTTTTCIEILFKEQLIEYGEVREETLGEYRDMLLDNNNNNNKENIIKKTNWKDNFNLLTSICTEEPNLAMFSFFNSSCLSTNNKENSVKEIPQIVVDDTVLMEPSEDLPATEIINDNEDSNSTVILNSEENSCASFHSTAMNNFHEKLFNFDNDDNRNKGKANKIFEKLNLLMKNTEEEDEIIERKIKDHKAKEEEEETDNIDDVSLEESDEEEERGEQDVENVDLDKTEDEEDDEEEILRKDVNKGRKSAFYAREFVEEEAELSESEGGQDYGEDEDERDLDVYEDEEGDEDKTLPSEGLLRRQIEKIHHKLEVDRDAQDLRYIKELYLEDGDLGDLNNDGGQRKKRFTWGNELIDTFPNQSRQTEDDDEGEEDEIAQDKMIEIEEKAEERENGDDKAQLENCGRLLSRNIFQSSSSLLSNKIKEIRPAWNSSEAVAAPLQSIKRFGSIMNKDLKSFNSSAAAAATLVSKNSMSDYDLKTTMSFMYKGLKRSNTTVAKDDKEAKNKKFK